MRTKSALNQARSRVGVDVVLCLALTHSRCLSEARPMRALSIGFSWLLAACSSGDYGTGTGTNAGTSNGGANDGGTGGNGSAGVNSGVNGASNGAGGASSGNSTGDGGASSGASAGTNTGGNVPTVAGCPVFTADDAWNTPVEQAKVNGDYTARLTKYLNAKNQPDLHPDFGAAYQGGPFGIPITIVPQNQVKTPISFDYADESDPGPYPFPGPKDVKIEGRDPYSTDGDRHILTVQQGTCLVWEAWACSFGSAWECGSGAKFDLKKNSYGQRTKGYTSADAAGLSILAGLIRYDETQAGAIRHAIRFTLGCSANAYTKPASHQAVPPSCNASDPNAMPMGVRVRLKDSYNTSALKGAALVIVQAMKTYGMILADNGSDFYFQGEPDARWNDDDLNGLKDIPSSAFEVVDPVMPEK